MELLTKKFQQEAQQIINSYTEMEVKQFEKDRCTNLEIGLKRIVRCHATKIVAVEQERRKAAHVLARTEVPIYNVSMDDVCGFTYLFLLLGPACTALTEWSELKSPSEMMDALTTKLATPARISELDLEALKDKTNVTKLGNMSFITPNSDTWSIAQQTAEDLHLLVAEFSLGAKTKFYNKIVDAKGNKAARDLLLTKETIDITDKVTKMLKHVKGVDKKLKINVIKKFIAKNTYAILKQRGASIKSLSPALGNKNKDKPTAKITTPTDKNNNTSDNSNQSDEGTAKRMRENRIDIEQQHNSRDGSVGNNERGGGRGGRGGGRGRGGRGRGGRGRGVNNTNKRHNNRIESEQEKEKANKRQKPINKQA